MILKRVPIATIALAGVIAAGFGLSLMTLRDVAILSGQNYPVPILAQLGVKISVAWLLPLALDGWVMVAMGAWLRAATGRARDFAQRQTYGAAAVSVVAQASYHGVMALDLDAVAVKAAFAVVFGAVPPLIVASGIHLYMITSQPDDAPDATADAATEAEAQAALARMETALARMEADDTATLATWIPEPAPAPDRATGDAAAPASAKRHAVVQAWVTHWARLPEVPASEPDVVKRLMVDMDLSRRTVERARQDALILQAAQQR